MSWARRLVGIVVLALHAAAPVSAYAHANAAAGPDFSALCSALQPLPKAPGAPLPHSAHDHHQHCAACGAPGVALPPSPVVPFAAVAATGVRLVLVAATGTIAATLQPRVRGPPATS